MSFEPPIQNIDRIDVLAKQQDDSVDLVIVASAPIDGSATTLAFLERKIRNYIAEVGTSQFRSEFGPLTADQIRICVVCEYEVDDLAKALIERLKVDAARGGTSLELRRSFK